MRAWITSHTIDPEDAFTIMFRIDSAPKEGILTNLQELARAPSCLRMDSVHYAGLTYYCLRSVFDKEKEKSGDDLLEELRADPEFTSQAWSDADFSIIWYWGGNALARYPLGSCVCGFTFGATTLARQVHSSRSEGSSRNLHRPLQTIRISWVLGPRIAS